MSVISFKCPNCDGELIFDPASGAYKCEYCGSKFTQEELDAMKPAEEQEKPAGSMRLLRIQTEHRKRRRQRKKQSFIPARAVVRRL